jgi:phospholipid/cholesterol/gamma-HCH transport system substrate-binding protein
MSRLNVEVVVGMFLVAGFLCFAYLSVKLGEVSLWRDDTYIVIARFGSVSGLKDGAVVEIAGVKVGTVAAIRLDGEDYEARVELAIDRDVKLQDDAIASIRTAGIIGDRYVDIAPGGAEEYIAPGGELTETESAINLETLVSKYIFEKK